MAQLRRRPLSPIWLVLVVLLLGLGLAAYEQRSRGDADLVTRASVASGSEQVEESAPVSGPEAAPAGQAGVTLPLPEQDVAGSAPPGAPGTRADAPGTEQPPEAAPHVAGTERPPEAAPDAGGGLEAPRLGPPDHASERAVALAPAAGPMATLPAAKRVPEPTLEVRDEARPAEPEETLASTVGSSGQSTASAGRVPSKQEPREPPAAQARASAVTGVPPSFDIVRVQRGGRAVIAGRAAPGAEVEVRAGGATIDRVTADQRGQWVATPTLPLAAGEQELTLAARSTGAAPIESDQVVVVAVPQGRAPQVAVSGSEPGGAEATSVAADAGPADEALAVLVSRKGDGRGRILQAPGRIGEAGELALVMLDYDHTGQIQLSGEAPPGVPLRIYVDNRLSAEARVDDKGAWIATLDRELAPGNYTLRLDQLGPQGKTVARLETPFTRAGQPPVEGEVQIDYVVVQPGNSLWRIARRLLGSGVKYVEVYDANRAQIRDPDLIYPGQVFAVPPTLDSG